MHFEILCSGLSLFRMGFLIFLTIHTKFNKKKNTKIQLGFSFLPSKFLEGHTRNIAQNRKEHCSLI